MSAAITVIARNGYHRTRIADIAAEAGVAYGLVYHYFGSKESILGAIFESIWERFGLRIQRISRQSKTTVAKLSDISDYMFDTFLVRPDLIRLLVHEVVRAHNIENLPDMEVVRRIIGMIESIVQSGIDNRELAPDADARIHALAFFGSMEMLLTALCTGLYPASTPTELKLVKRKMRLFLQNGSFGAVIGAR
ncbi:MAG: TetR/AcrR family transcriptional regulator [Spirochaetia bacterium]|nr:TetR/AcrR family transcriptional regulator [Spirochaetia bacterium]